MNDVLNFGIEILNSQTQSLETELATVFRKCSRVVTRGSASTENS